MILDFLSDREAAALSDRLRRLEADSGLSEGELTVRLIQHLIEEGINLNSQIVNVLTQMPTSHGHIRQLISYGVGIVWTRNGDRTLSNLY